jgi:hypothetical protein
MHKLCPSPLAPAFIFHAKLCLILAWSILDEPPGQEGRALLSNGALSWEGARSPEKERAPCEQILKEPFAIEKGAPSWEGARSPVKERAPCEQFLSEPPKGH